VNSSENHRMIPLTASDCTICRPQCRPQLLVAQVSKPAVSPISKSAGSPLARTRSAPIKVQFPARLGIICKHFPANLK
jgi:hypothetical protein